MNRARLSRARSELAARGLDALVVAGRQNVRWLTGFSGSSGMAVLTPAEVYICTDGRYTLQAAEEAPGCIFRISPEATAKMAGELLKELGAGAAAFEPDVLTVEQHGKLAEAAGDACQLRPVSGVIEALRSVKDAAEQDALRKAAAVTDAAFREILPHIRPGASEMEIARELACILSRCGAEQESFPCIVASGPRSALPHARPTARAVQPGEPVLLDFGAQVDGYAADITRVVFVGQPSAEMRSVYGIVLEAQMAGIAAVRPGAGGREVDAAARKVIEDAGYGAHFGHGLGHQIGLSVHDGPGLSPKSEVVLQEGMAVTVEPGVYLEGVGGIRIEDDVLVTQSGCEVITRSPKGLLSV